MVIDTTIWNEGKDQEADQKEMDWKLKLQYRYRKAVPWTKNVYET